MVEPKRNRKRHASAGERPSEQPKASKKRKRRPKEATILIPLTFNDRSKVPKATIQEITDELFLAFQGYLVEGTVEGAYRMKRTGNKRVEKLLKITVGL